MYTRRFLYVWVYTCVVQWWCLVVPESGLKRQTSSDFVSSNYVHSEPRLWLHSEACLGPYSASSISFTSRVRHDSRCLGQALFGVLNPRRPLFAQFLSNVDEGRDPRFETQDAWVDHILLLKMNETESGPKRLLNFPSDILNFASWIRSFFKKHVSS